LCDRQGPSDASELVPESDTDYSVPAIRIRISFVRDASGKVTGFIGYQDGDFDAKRLN
jgi:hypothetical protein